MLIFIVIINLIIQKLCYIFEKQYTLNVWVSTFLIGSTETIGFHLVSDQTLPMYLEEISSPSLGVAIECLDDKGNYAQFCFS